MSENKQQKSDFPATWMDIRLENVQVHLGLSEESYAYTATIVVNGKRTATAKNGGRGGCDIYHALWNKKTNLVNKSARDRLEQAKAWCKTLPTIESEIIPGRSFTHEADLEWVVGELLEAEIVRQDIKKAARGKTILVKTVDRDPGTYSLGSLTRAQARANPNWLKWCLANGFTDITAKVCEPDRWLDYYRAEDWGGSVNPNGYIALHQVRKNLACPVCRGMTKHDPHPAGADVAEAFVCPEGHGAWFEGEWESKGGDSDS